jgi:capsular exopolysaccharide synthesis family protein
MGKIQEAIDRAKSGNQYDSTGQYRQMAVSSSDVMAEQPAAAKPDWAARRVNVVEDELCEERIIAGLDYDDRVEPYRQLRAQVLKIMRDNGWHSLAITSAHMSAGKTVTAVNLAISISRDVNNQVLLVDLDLRTPSVDEKLHVDVTNGLVDYLNGDVQLDDVLVNPGYERLFVLPGKSTEKFSSELLASPQMKQLLNELDDDADDSRIIILDLPPLLRNDDALVVTPVADATLFVVEDGVTTADQLKQSLQMLKGANLIGTVLNKAEV